MGELSEWLDKNKEGLVVGAVAALFGGDYARKKIDQYLDGFGDALGQRIAEKVDQNLQTLKTKYNVSEQSHQST